VAHSRNQDLGFLQVSEVYVWSFSVFALNGHFLPRRVQDDEVTIRTPSTIGNFGPGFDVTSLALAWGGDTITVTRLDEGAPDEVVLVGASDGIPEDWQQNAASLSFDAVRKSLGEQGPVRLTIDKGVPAGSGLGSSASSAAGGTLAALRFYRPEEPWTPALMLDASLGAESKVAGKHGDDVAAVLLGGLAMVHAGRLRRWDPPEGLALAIVRPEVSLSTRKMRSVLPQEVPIKHAVANLGSLAFLLSAWQHGDVEEVQRSLGDHLAAPYRRELLPFFEPAQAAARDAGARQIAISGSGPSLFTVTRGIDVAKEVSKAMAQAIEETGVKAEPVACWPEKRHVWKEVTA
jgi:homoserine kinase